jgi:hypothetical protein
VLASELQPASVVFAGGLNVTLEADLHEEALFIRFINSDEAVEHQVDWVMQALDDTVSAIVLSPGDAEATWMKIADFDQRDVRVRLSVPLSSVPAEFERAHLAHPVCVATADIGAGIIRMGFNTDLGTAADEIKQLRAGVVAAKGSLVIEHAPEEVRRQSDAWGEVGSTAVLMQSIKSSFDPKGMLNPGKFVSGI